MHEQTDLERWHHAVNTRDAAYDGRFIVALVSTGIYCRPVCPSRLARPENRRFFATAVDAAAAGFRACRRCRPELCPGEAPVDAVPRLAKHVAARISAGALDRGSLRELASTMGMSERHVRRAVERELGASPKRLAVAQRLRRATALLADPRQTVTQVAYTSGFQSLRRFNAAFRAQFAMSPTAWRRRSSRG